MPKQLWTILCTSISIDQETNVISLFGVIEQLQIGGGMSVDQQLVLPSQFNLVTLWTRSDADKAEKAVARYNLQLPNGEIKPGGEIQVELTSSIRNRSIVKINGLPIHGPGEYKFLIEIRADDSQEWIRAHELPLQVEFI